MRKKRKNSNVERNENNNNKLIVRNVGKTKIQTLHTTSRRKLQLKVDIFTTVATKVQ